MRMTARLQEICEDILDNVEDAASCVLEAARLEVGESHDLLSEHLEETLARIQEALGELGCEDAPFVEQQADSLPEVAVICCGLARDLFDAEGELRASEDLLGAQLNALRDLIEREPGGFLDLARTGRERT